MRLLKIFSVLALLTLVAPVIAQDNMGKVIMASESNYPDALVSSAVSEKLGIPVLLTGKNQLAQEVKNTLQDLNPTEIIVVGGPSVVSDSIIQELENDYQVTRLWGITRYGTAKEIATHFWPEGVNEALLVEDDLGEDSSQVLGLARNLANGKPILPIPKNKISAEILNQLREMNTTQVRIVGTQISNEIIQDLQELGLQIQERIQAQNKEQLKNKLRNQTREELNKNDTLVVVAASNFKHTITAPNLPQSSSFLVSSEDQIEDAVNTINNNNILTVKVVGKPDLAGQIATTLENKTDAEINLVVSGAVKAVSNLVKEDKGKFASKFNRGHPQWEQKIQNQVQTMKNRANQSMERARNLISDYNLSIPLEEAQNEFEQGNYHKALEKARQTRHKIRKQRWNQIRNNATTVRERVQEEVQSLKQRTQELKQINQQFGNQMQQNMTVEERLQIIEQFHERRMNKVKQIAQQATQIGRTGNIGNWINQAEKGIRKGVGKQPGPGQRNNQTTTTTAQTPADRGQAGQTTTTVINWP